MKYILLTLLTLVVVGCDKAPMSGELSAIGPHTQQVKEHQLIHKQLNDINIKLESIHQRLGECR